MTAQFITVTVYVLGAARWLLVASCARLNMEKIPAVLDPFFFHEEHYAPVWESRVLVGKDRQMVGRWLFSSQELFLMIYTHGRNMKWLITFLGFIYTSNRRLKLAPRTDEDNDTMVSQWSHVQPVGTRSKS